MKKFILFFVLIPFLIFSENIRKPNFAGSFYPENTDSLSKMINDFLKNVDNKKIKVEKDKIIGIIAPHAGYVYSGQVAAYSFKTLEGMTNKTFIIIGRSHHAYFKEVIIEDRDFWQTPLGKVEIDKSLFEELYAQKQFHINHKLLDIDHAIEVEIPFLQKVCKNFKIFPILLGDLDNENINKISSIIYNVIKKRNDIIFVVSSDLSHYYPENIAEEKDNLLFKYLKTKDINLIYNKLKERKEVEACGDAAILLLMKIAEKIGPYKVDVLNHSNSGKITGEKKSVVGYGSIIILKSEKKEENMLTKEQKEKLLKIVRETLEFYLKNKPLPEIKETDPVLNEKRGVFVTLKKRGNLRGCIGYIYPVVPLIEGVRKMAIESATGDPRFSPVTYEELKDIEIEISVLTVPKRVKSSDEIVLGRDGVIVKRGFNQGVFLPQVADETGWSKEEFLSQLCWQKAGIPPDAWKDPETELYTFQAEVFSESEFK